MATAALPADLINRLTQEIQLALYSGAANPPEAAIAVVLAQLRAAGVDELKLQELEIAMREAVAELPVPVQMAQVEAALLAVLNGAELQLQTGLEGLDDGVTRAGTEDEFDGDDVPTDTVDGDGAAQDAEGEASPDMQAAMGTPADASVIAPPPPGFGSTLRPELTGLTANQYTGGAPGAPGAPMNSAIDAPEITALTGDRWGAAIVGSLARPEEVVLTVDAFSGTSVVGPSPQAPSYSGGYMPPPPAAQGPIAARLDISAPQTSVIEGAQGALTQIVFILTRSSAMSADTIQWQATGLDAARFPGGVIPQGAVTFAIGQTEARIVVTIAGNDVVQPAGSVGVQITAHPSTITLGDTSVRVTVVNDDSTFAIQANGSSVVEGGAGELQQVSFTITREGALGVGDVSWSAGGLPAQFFPNGVIPTGVVQFAEGQRTATITVTIQGNALREADRSLTVALSQPGENSSLGAQSTASVQVLDDDSLYSITADRSEVLEGGTGEVRAVTFTVTRDNVRIDGQVAWTVTGLSANDFVGGVVPSGTVQFAAGETSRTITVHVRGDAEVEPHETLIVHLGVADQNSGIAVDQAQTVIRNDDGYVTVTPAQPEVQEGVHGQVTVIRFIVTRTEGSVPGTVDWTLSGYDPEDFGGQLPSGTITFGEGELEREIIIEVPGNPQLAPDREVTLVIEPGPNLTLDAGAPPAIVTVRDATGYTINAVNADRSEGGVGEQTSFTFRITRSADVDQAATINYRLVPTGQHAVDVHDFVVGQDGLGNNAGLPSGVVSFAAGETEKIITITVAGDAIVGEDESFALLLSDAPAGARILVGSATGVIRNDDAGFAISALHAELPEGSGAPTHYTFQVTRTGDLSTARTVNYAVQGHGEIGTSADDFTSPMLTGTVHFAAGQSVATLVVPINGDNTVESTESFSVVLTDAGANAQVLASTAIGVVGQDDAAISIRALQAVQMEGSDVGHPHTFVITRSGNLDSQITVQWQVSGTGAHPVDAADFGGTLPGGVITFAPGQLTQIISFTPSPDALFEQNETYVVSLTSPDAGVEVIGGQATGVIVNDEIGLAVAAGDLDIREGDDGTPMLTFTVTRSGVIQLGSSVDWSLVPASVNGVQAADFIGGLLPSGTLVFQPGEQSLLVSIPIVADSILESDEFFSIQLSNPSAGSDIVVGSVDGAIRNDDVRFDVSVAASVDEGHSGGTPVVFTVHRTGDLSGFDSISYTVTGSGEHPLTADDFVGGAFPAGVVSFAPGAATATVTILVQGDNVLETDEQMTLTLHSPGPGATLGQASATVIVRDDDDVLSIRALDADRNEGSGAGNGAVLTFVVERSGDLSSVTLVDWRIDGSGVNAADASDFLAITGSLTFGPGVSSQVISVQVSPDHLHELDETFTVTLVNPDTNTAIGTAVATGTIRNDDTMVSITATETQLAEGSGSNSIHVFTVTRTGVLSEATTVNWSVAGSGLNPAAANDFAVTSGVVTFLPGQTTATIQIEVIGDLTVEPDEHFTVTLTQASGNVEIRDASAEGVIVSDDAGLSVSAAVAQVSEGAVGQERVVQFIVTRSGDATAASTAHWSVSGLDANDFAGGVLPSGMVTFAAGVTQQIISVTLAGDAEVEADETLTLTLSDPSVGTHLLVATASTVVLNDDAAIALPGTAVTAEEGPAGQSRMVTIEVTRSGNLDQSTTVDWHLQAAGTYGVNLNDFDLGQDALGNNGGLPSGQVTFAPGETTATITFMVRGDDSVEADEGFQVVLSNAGDNVSLTTPSVQGVIRNDDIGFSISPLQSSQLEGADGGEVAFTFTVTRAGDLGSAASVDWAVSGHGASAADAADFLGGVLPSGVLNFAANEISRTITVMVRGDALVESDETFRVQLSNARLADNSAQTIVDAQALATIVNDDSGFSVASDQASWVEGSSGGYTDVTFTVTRRGDLSVATTLNYVVTGSNGANGDDVEGGVLPAGVLTFAEGEVSQTVTVRVYGDTEVESDEIFTVTLSGASHGSIETASAQAIVRNDDIAFSIAADQAQVNEGHAGTTSVTYTVTRHGDVSQAASVSWAVQSGGGIDAADFGGSIPSGVLTFAIGQSTRTITIPVRGDTTVENDESLTVVLSAPTAGFIVAGEGSATTVLLGDDDGFAISAGAASVVEGHSGVRTLTFTVERSGPAHGTKTVNWAASGLSADDFAGGVLPAGTLTFVDGQTSQTITVEVVGDTRAEADETLVLTLSNPSSGATVTTATAQTVIVNDDASVSIAALLADHPEGNTGTVPFTFQVTRSGYLGQSSTVEWRLQGSGANPANSSDFLGADVLGNNSGLPSGTVTFAAGESVKTITVNVRGDSLNEQDERFSVNLSNPTAGTEVNSASASAEGIIRNDDSEVNFTGTTTVSQFEGDSGYVTYTYTLTRTGNLQQSSTVYLTTGGTVTWGSEAVLTNSTVTFANGESSKQVQVRVYGDTVVETDETFTLTLSSPSAGTSVGASNIATGVVQEDDTRLTITTGNLTQEEGRGGGVTYFEYVVTRSGYTGGTTTINWNAYGYAHTVGYDATNVADFLGGVLPSGTLTFNPGQTTATIRIAVNADDVVENNEVFLVQLLEGTGSGYDAIGNAWRYGYVTRDESLFSILGNEVVSETNRTQLTGATARMENDDGTVTHTFAVRRTISTTGEASVDWTLDFAAAANGTIRADAGDFVAGQPLTGTLQFVHGQEWGYITVTTTADLRGEDLESFRILLSNPSAGTSVDAYATGAWGYIGNDDPLLSINSVEVNEGSDGGFTPVTLTVTRSGDLLGEATVQWLANFPGVETGNESNVNPALWYRADRSDLHPDDLISGMLTFADGVATQTITFRVLNDVLTESWYERFTVSLSNATLTGHPRDKEIAISQLAHTGTVTILDDEPDPLITIAANQTEVQEGTGGVTQMGFTISRTDTERDGSLNYPTTLRFIIESSSVTRPGLDNNDYTTTYTVNGGVNLTLSYDSWRQVYYGDVVFAAGETSKNLVFNVVTDNWVEPDETFTVTLDPRAGAGNNYGPAGHGEQITASTVIRNDDVRLYWSVETPTVTVREGDAGPASIVLNLSRAGRLDHDITLTYNIVHGTTNNADFVNTTGTVTLVAGQSSYQLTLPIVNGDTTIEADETFTLRLTSANPHVTFARYASDAGTSTANFGGTLINDDTVWNLSTSTPALLEGDTGQQTTFVYTVTRSDTGYLGAASMQWRVASSQADAADFVSGDVLGTNGGLPSGTLTFAAGATSATFTVTVRGDIIAELNEDFTVSLQSPTFGRIGTGSVTSTIRADDTGIHISDASNIIEGDSGTTAMTFTVTRTGDLSGASSMSWRVQHDTTNDSDFLGPLSGVLNFVAGQSTATITVQVAGDIEVESHESFYIQLHSFSGIDEVIRNVATGTILNDDVRYAIAALEADGPEDGPAHTFVISRTGMTTTNQTIHWAVTSDMADAADFGGVLPSGQVTFLAGETSKTISIPISADMLAELDEHYTVTITAGAGVDEGEIEQATAEGVIRNDDNGFSVAADHEQVLEGHNGATAYTFTLSRTGNTDVPASVDWSVAGYGANPASAGDFLGGVFPGGTVNFEAGELVKTITVQLAGDVQRETNEGFRLTLSNPIGASLVQAVADGVIVDDDAGVSIAALDAVKEEGDSGSTAFTFTITRTGYLGAAATVNWTVSGSGVNPANAQDFVGNGLPFGVVAFEAGQASVTLTVEVQGDLLGDADKQFTVTLSDPSMGVAIDTATATGTIIADDVVFDVSAPATVVEGSGGGFTDVQFLVTRAGDLRGSQTLDWAVSGIGSDPATSADFQATSGTVTFNAGQTSQIVTVRVRADDSGEPNEQFRFSLGGDDSVQFTRHSADVTIIDDEASLRIVAVDANKYEGGYGVLTAFTFRVERTGNVDLAVGVDWSVAGAAVNISDFVGGVLPSGRVEFAVGQTQQQITVLVAGDLQVESDESFTVQLSNASAGADIITGSASGVIRSDDTEWTLSRVSAESQAEGHDGTTLYTFRITREGGLSEASVQWSVGGTGLHPANAADFGGTLPSGTVVFAAGETEKTFTVAVSGDDALENDETFLVTIDTPAGVGSNTVLVGAVSATIANDDSQFSIVAANAQVLEGDSGTTPATFTVNRTGSLQGAATVHWRIAAGSQTNADDFVATSGVLNFASGAASGQITLEVIGDLQVEGHESFVVELYDPSSGSTIATATADGVIYNQDVGLALTGNIVDGNEGDSGSSQRTFTVTRTGDLSEISTVSWSVSGADVDAADFLAGQDGLGTNGGLPSGVVTFAAGQGTATIVINISGDGVYEADESFTVTLHSPSGNATIGDNDVVAHIRNDDDQLAIVAVDADQLEGAEGTTTVYTFRVDRIGSTVGATSVDWSVAGIGDHPLSAAELVSTGGTVQFAAGQDSAFISVVVRGDSRGEFDETFRVTLDNAAFGSTIVTASADGVVRNDDAALAVVAEQTSQYEGNSGVTTYTFTITRTGDLSAVASVDWAVEGRGDSPTDALDFGSYLPSGVLTFAAGESTKQVTVQVSGDEQGESDETFALVLSNAVNADIILAEATAVILNDDVALAIEPVSADHAEGDTGTTAFTFRVVRSGSLSGSVSVDWAVGGAGEFRADAADFLGGVLPTGSLVFADGQTEQFITVQVAGDALPGADETFVVRLNNISGGEILTAEALGTIRNDDSEVAIQAVVGSVVEGNAGVSELRYLVTRSGDLSRTATVDWVVSGFGEHAADAADFLGGVLPSGSITFAAGETQREIVIRVAGDTVPENTERLQVSLTNPGENVTVSATAGSALGSIVADDVGVLIQAVDAVRAEGTGSASTPFLFQIVRTGPLNAPLTVSYQISGVAGSAINAADFVNGLSGTVTLAAGVASLLLPIQVAADSQVEADERFAVTINAPGAILLQPTAEGIIRDDDGGFAIHAAQAAQVEGNSGSTAFVFHITRNGANDTAATVDWSVEAMQATASDFLGGVLPSGTLHFAAGEVTKTISVQVAGDTVIEPSERFAVVLSNASIPVATARAEMLIINDDAAGDGNDVLVGSALADVVEGRGGNDVLYGAGGSDTLRGGAGADRFHYAAPSEGGDVILDFEAGVDHISFVSGGFGGLGSGGVLSATSVGSAGDLSQTLAAVRQAQDVDVYRIEFAPGEFRFGRGNAGELDELESAFSAGDHSGAAFIFVSDGAGDSRLYYDADTSAGTDASGWVEVAKLPSVDVLTLPDDMVQTAV